MKLTYKKFGDYYLPKLTIKNKKIKQINRYGMLRLHYLKENDKAFYTTLLMTNELTNHLLSVGNECENKLQILMENYKNSNELLSEKNKNDNPLEWVRLMNNYKSMAEEIILKGLIYTENV